MKGARVTYGCRVKATCGCQESRKVKSRTRVREFNNCAREKLLRAVLVDCCAQRVSEAKIKFEASLNVNRSRQCLKRLKPTMMSEAGVGVELDTRDQKQ